LFIIDRKFILKIHLAIWGIVGLMPVSIRDCSFYYGPLDGASPLKTVKFSLW